MELRTPNKYYHLLAFQSTTRFHSFRECGPVQVQERGPRFSTRLGSDSASRSIWGILLERPPPLQVVRSHSSAACHKSTFHLIDATATKLCMASPSPLQVARAICCLDCVQKKKQAFKPFESRKKVEFLRIEKRSKGGIKPLPSMLDWTWATPVSHPHTSLPV